jgi:hypothetical protein
MSDGGTAGLAGAGSTIPVTFADSCGTLTPCGGDLTGTWEYTAVCVDYDFGEAAQAFCAEATVETSGSLSGTMTFTATTMRRVGELDLDATLHLPASCVQGTQCALVTVALSAMLSAQVDDIDCADATDGCECSLGRTQSVDESATYETTGSTLTTTGEAGAQRTFEYCVEGDTLTYLETTEGGTEIADPGISELTRR